MNTTASKQSHLAALALSAVLTLAMLVGINQLAVSDAPTALLAQVGSARA